MVSIILDCSNQGRDPSRELMGDCLVRLARNDPGMECFFLKERFDDLEPTSFAPVKPLLLPKAFWPFRKDFGKLPLPDGKGQTRLLIGEPSMKTSRLPFPYAFWISGPDRFNDSARMPHRIRETWLKAALIFTDSASNRGLIMERFSLLENQVITLKGAADDHYQPLDPEQKRQVRQRYTGSKDYFFVQADQIGHGQLIQLLKAFALFKKKQRSNMRLVLAGLSHQTNRDFSAQKESFRYREDLLFPDVLPKVEKARLVAASYGMLLASEANAPTAVLNAFQAMVPVIAMQEMAIRETAGDAVLYASTPGFEALANQMILLYKDEALRSQLMNNGQKRLLLFDGKETVTQLRSSICNALDVPG